MKNKHKAEVIWFVYIPIMIFVQYACNHEYKRVMQSYSNGKPLVIFDYPNKSNKTNFKIIVYFPSGDVHRILKVQNGNFVDSLITFFKDGALNLVDSLIDPCDTSKRACNAERTIFYPNGKIAERYSLKHGKYNGFSQHFDQAGVIVKDYFLIDDSIKNGIYRDYDQKGKLQYMANYLNDTLNGFSFYFAGNGDTLKYFNNIKGEISFPYKKWLNKGITLVGNYENQHSEVVVWNWYDSNNNTIKTIKVKSTKNGFIVPN